MNNLLFLSESQTLETTARILTIVFFAIAIIVILYIAFTFKRIGSAAKKINYFYEDLTYKSEMLNSTVDSINRISNYVDLFDALAKRNVKSWSKVATQNKDVIYKLIDKLRDFANSED
ncbi:hypothetical protein [Spiroplasma endosymbiont of Crioceris asparagi]|uniref:hypothetical protein n=1 Tax=Spiroplasma endosymbiont of Crioceris asparagi TaxID=3066286 RepID=UPI0030D468AA